MAVYSEECLQLLELLRDRKNVLIMGPPSCGKTRLLSEVAHAFEHGLVVMSTPSAPQHVPGAAVPIPAKVPTGTGSTALPQLPSPSRTTRRVFKTVFNANSKPRDFLTGLVPDAKPGAASASFRVVEGKLVQANKFALQSNRTALLVIDELNRGPAVQLFGDSLVALEANKRLDADDKVTQDAWPFDVLDAHGESVPMWLSGHLYILAALNQADVSVEPLDVAFIRRWEPFRIKPQADEVRKLLGAAGEGATLPTMPTTPGEVVEAAIRAWSYINKQIETGRGEEFQLGHGVFLSVTSAPLSSTTDALKAATSWWNAIVAHVDEVFFGDAFGIAATLRADPGSAFYHLEAVTFGQDQRQVLRRPPSIHANNVYPLLLWIGGNP